MQVNIYIIHLHNILQIKYDTIYKIIIIYNIFKK